MQRVIRVKEIFQRYFPALSAIQREKRERRERKELYSAIVTTEREKPQGKKQELLRFFLRKVGEERQNRADKTIIYAKVRAREKERDKIRYEKHRKEGQKRQKTEKTERKYLLGFRVYTHPSPII